VAAAYLRVSPRTTICAISWPETADLVISSVHYPHEWECLQNPRMGMAMNRRLIHALIIIVALFTGWRIYTLMIVPAGPFRWDEAAHALRGLLIAEDLRQGSWLGFLLDTYRQVYWPPLHSWLTGLAFLVAGSGMVVARTCSLVAYLLTVPLLYLAARSMRKTGRELAGLTAVILFLTSPPLIDFASQCMLEAPGLFAVSLTILIYFKVCRDDVPAWKHLLLGLGIAFAYFVKSNYGILLLLTIVITLLSEARFRPRALFTRANYYMALPMVVIFSLWFAYPKKLIATWEAMVNVPCGVTEPYGLEGVLYYPYAFHHLSGSVWLCALFLLSLLVAYAFRRHRNVRFLLVLVILQMVMGELHHDKVERHIFPILPALFLLAGYAAAEGWTRLQEMGNGLRSSLAYVAGGVLLLHAVSLGAASMRPYLKDQGKEAGEYIATVVRNAAPAFLLGTMDPFNPPPPLIDWQLITREGLMTIHQAGSLSQIEEERRLASTLEHSGVPAWFINAIVPVLTRADRSSRIRTLYLGLPPNASYSLSQEDLGRFLQQTIEGNPCCSLVVVTSLSDKKRYPLADVALTLQKAGMRPLSTKLFHEAGMRVDVYDVRSCSPSSLNSVSPGDFRRRHEARVGNDPDLRICDAAHHSTGYHDAP
jgi:4-amino-4-deoxy-L-arabinose transferase-like glycosyltransferase